MQRLAILTLLGLLNGLAVTGCEPMEEYRGPGDSVPVAGGRGRGGTGPGSAGRQAQSEIAPQYAAALAMTPSMGSGDAAVTRGFLPANPGQEPDRMMIYSATMGLEVARVEDAIARCLETVNDLGGYLSRRTNSTLTCRVPAARFDAFLEDLRTYGRVLNESMQAVDVTRQHVDLEIRLDNARRSRTRLLELLDRAEAVEDMIKIEQELRRLTSEIERMEGELKSLDDQVAMSTVTVAFQPVGDPGPPNGPRRPSRFPWINMTGVEYVLRWF